MKKIYSLSTIMTLALMLVSVMAFAQAELLVHYTFDETADDASGNGNNGIITGTSEYVTGEIGSALLLDGDGGVTLPAHNMNMDAGEGAVSLWVNCTEPASIYTVFWAGTPGTDTDPLSMGGGFGPEMEMHVHLEQAATNIWEGGEVSFFAIADPNTFIHSDPEKGGPAGNVPVNPTLVGDSAWHHIAATWGDGIVTLYIDNVLMWDTTAYYDLGYDLDSIFLGRMGNGGRTFIGAIDDARVYAEPLDEDEISDLFNKVEPPVENAIDQLQADAVNLSVFPNPASSNAQVSFLVDAGQHVAVNLVSVTGSVMSNVYEGISIAGTNLVDLNTTSITPGVYFVELQVGNSSTYSKLVIQ